MPRKTTNTDDAVREIAALQQQLADLINETARKAERIEITIAEKTDALRRTVEAVTFPPETSPVIEWYSAARSAGSGRISDEQSDAALCGTDRQQAP